MKKNIFVLLVFFIMTVFGGTAHALIPCTSSISPKSYSFSRFADSTFVIVTSTCAWTATTSASWIGVSPTGGPSNGLVKVSVSANPNPSLRFGTATIAGKTFTVTQAKGLIPCTSSISPTSHSFSRFAGSTAVTVTSTCAWTATTSSLWIGVSPTSGSSNGTVTVSVLANPSPSLRFGTATIAGKTFTVTQAKGLIPCTSSISPTSHSFSRFAGSTAVTVTSTCAWTATTSSLWIGVSPTSGSSNGTVTVSVLANPSPSLRFGTATIAGKTFNVSQQAFIPVTYSYEYSQPYYSSSTIDWIGIALSNASNYYEASIEIVVRATNGDLITEIYKNLPASGKTAFVVDTLGSGWMNVRSDQPLSGLVFLGRDSLMADIPFVDSPEASLVIPHSTQNAEWDTTILLCNPQSSNVSVNVINVDEQGLMVAQKSLILPAKGSGSYLLSDFFGVQELGGKIYLQATSGISAFALYSNVKSGGSYFAGINAVAESYIIK